MNDLCLYLFVYNWVLLVDCLSTVVHEDSVEEFDHDLGSFLLVWQSDLAPIGIDHYAAHYEAGVIVRPDGVHDGAVVLHAFL